MKGLFYTDGIFIAVGRVEKNTFSIVVGTHQLFFPTNNSRAIVEIPPCLRVIETVYAYDDLTNWMNECRKEILLKRD